MATPIDLNNKEYLCQCVKTSLASKILSQNSDEIAPIAVDAVLRTMNSDNTVDLNDIKIVKKIGGTIDDMGNYSFLFIYHKVLLLK